MDEILQVTGLVIPGDGIAGFEFGVPTANLEIENDIQLEPGVYAGLAEVDGWRFQAAVSYGGNPVKFEVHLLNFDGNLLGRKMSVRVMDKVSEFLEWNSKERLRQKILHDLQMVHELFEQEQRAKKAPR